MLADVADEYELQTGWRQEDVFFGAQLITYKATSGLGKFVSGIALTIIAWPTAAEAKAAGGAIAEDKLFWLAMTYGPIMSLFAILAVLCYSRYRLDAAEHARILDALGVKRQKAAAAQSAPALAIKPAAGTA